MRYPFSCWGWFSLYLVVGVLVLVDATRSVPFVGIRVRYGKTGVTSNGIFSRADRSATGFVFANST